MTLVQLTRVSEIHASLSRTSTQILLQAKMRKKQINPKKSGKGYRNYSPETLLKAYEAVKEKGLPVQKAARQYGVPEQTLRDRVKGIVNPLSCKQGKDTSFTHEEELTLVEHIETMAELGYGLTNTELQHTAGELAFDLGRKKNNKPLSNNWLYAFLKRWCHRLASLKPRKLDSNRAKSTTPEAVSSYYENLRLVFDKYGLHTKPQNIFNVDETGLQPEHRPPNVIAPINSKPQAVTSPRSTTTTLIACANAVGTSLPPFYVFKGKRFNSELMRGATPGTQCEMSETGWSNAAIFKKYLQQHFYPHIQGKTAAGEHVVLIYDGHASHINPTLIQWAQEHNIILFVLPAHTSHLLQPLDVSIFGPFKSFYYSECSVYMNKHIGKTITRYDICNIACTAYLKAMTPVNIIAGFRKTGIFPLSPDVIAMEKLLPCESFRDDQPLQKAKAMKEGKEAVEKFLQLKIERQVPESGQLCKTCECPIKRKLPFSTKPKPSGRAITEDSFMAELTEFENETKPEKHSATDSEQNSKKLNCKKQKTHGKEPKTTPVPISPKPSTSGINIRPTSSDSESELYDSDDDVSEQDLCCVCKKMSPPNLKDLPYLKIVSWAMCDKCGHWVHLALCTSVTVVRRHSTFLCPHCVD